MTSNHRCQLPVAPPSLKLRRAKQGVRVYFNFNLGNPLIGAHFFNQENRTRKIFPVYGFVVFSNVVCRGTFVETRHALSLRTYDLRTYDLRTRTRVHVQITLMDKYKNKYRIPSARAQWWDYGWDAAYFVTICTRCRECFFGDIHDDQMVLSTAGKIADSCWLEIIDHAKNVELGPYVVMPNHVHGILILTGNQAPFKFVPIERFVPFVETRHALSLPTDQDPDQPPKTIGQLRFQNPGKNTISAIIGGYKSEVSGKTHPLQSDFGWQTCFHDHIIRDEE
ncbi:MAG: hypothetical protein WD824_07565, partial [Cyclobacteriaceae bacterium]